MKASLEFEIDPQHPERDETTLFMHASHATQLVWLIHRIFEEVEIHAQDRIREEMATLGIQHLFPEI